MRLIPDTITTMADLIDYLRTFVMSPEDFKVFITILEREFDELTGGAS